MIERVLSAGKPTALKNNRLTLGRYTKAYIVFFAHLTVSAGFVALGLSPMHLNVLGSVFVSIMADGVIRVSTTATM